MSYQEELACDRHAQIVLGLPMKYRLTAEQMHDIAERILWIEAEALANGRKLHEQHLVQEATKIAKSLKSE